MYQKLFLLMDKKIFVLCDFARVEQEMSDSLRNYSYTFMLLFNLKIKYQITRQTFLTNRLM
ncbi:hypothetical protein T4B_9112 [Trichinella pseudospiralis]|uniref:Uncharacterized protein n=1 Tax=Trichinella pseudospiralis TaxID=6337 RepID=A0A0V1IJ06_TRIPS|nr:hypothetical protein T4B_9112 [Trichinella pseudospiralis]